jgi:hypothetical protein
MLFWCLKTLTWKVSGILIHILNKHGKHHFKLTNLNLLKFVIPFCWVFFKSEKDHKTFFEVYCNLRHFLGNTISFMLLFINTVKLGYNEHDVTGKKCS